MFLSGMVGTAQGGSEKKYKITSESNYYGMVRNEYSPGEFVGLSSSDKSTESSENVGTTQSGKTVVAVHSSKIDGIQFPATGRSFMYFVMPAEDVTIL